MSTLKQAYTFSSSPDQAPRLQDLFGTGQAFSSSPIKGILSDSNGNQIRQASTDDRQLSPTLDASFASSMSFNSNLSDQANAMDISPALPAASRPKRPTLKRTAPTADDTTFSKDFFSSMVDHKPSTTGSAAKRAQNIDIKRSFGREISGNIPIQPPLPLRGSIDKNHIDPTRDRSKSEAILDFEKGLIGPFRTRPGLTDAANYVASSAGNINEVISKARTTDSNHTRRPSMPALWHTQTMPAPLVPDLPSKNNWPLAQTDKVVSAPTVPTFSSLASHREETSSPQGDPMDVDVLSPQPKARTILTKHDFGTAGDGSFSELFDNPSPVQNLPRPLQHSNRNPRKRSFDADAERSFESSSDAAGHSSPLANVIAARPPLMKAASMATATFLSSTNHSSRSRRSSDRSHFPKPSLGSLFDAHMLANARKPSDTSPDRPEQSAKRARAEGGFVRPSLLMQSRRTQSVNDRSFLQPKQNVGDAPAQTQAKAASLGLGWPPVANPGYSGFRPAHAPSASDSILPNGKIRPVSESTVQPAASRLRGGWPTDWGTEADGKALPCHTVKDDGLMRILPRVVVDLLAGKYDSLISRFIIIDCRFPWEYQGGHIQGAINLHSEEQLQQFFFTPNAGMWQGQGALPAPSHSGEETSAGKTVIIMHCEFSAMRAPKNAGALRSFDRAKCKDFYPRVVYPELYILAGGYAQFFERNVQFCEPRGYVQMKESADCPRAIDDFRRRSQLGRAKSFTFGDDFQEKQLTYTTAAAPIKEESSIDTSASSTEEVADSPCPANNMRMRVLKGHSLPTRTFVRSATEAPATFSQRIVSH